MRKTLMLLAVAYVVSWDGQTQYTQVPCKKEPKDVLCVKPTPSRVTRQFSTKEAADEFAKVMGDYKASHVVVEEAHQ